jgi:hypothetical protein
MNNEDKKRFARYRKGYNSTLEDNELINLKKNDKNDKTVNNNQTKILGYVSNINIKSENLINEITRETTREITRETTRETTRENTNKLLETT